MKAIEVAFLGALVFRFPELLGVLEDHLADQGGEVLPHVLLASVTKQLAARAVSGGEQGGAAQAILGLSIKPSGWLAWVAG